MVKVEDLGVKHVLHVKESGPPVDDHQLGLPHVLVHDVGVQDDE